MFTGIIEEKATIDKIESTKESMVLTIRAQHIMEDIRLGDSISVNGVCLTVTSFTDDYFTVDVMPETMRETSLRLIEKGSFVNVERAMAANDRFGGHIVSGHVDGTGTITSIRPYENAHYLEIQLPRKLMKYMILKGSVTVDGISLTIFGLDDVKETITLSIIPHTWQETVLSEKKEGDPVNIEADMLAKYTERLHQFDEHVGVMSDELGKGRD